MAGNRNRFLDLLKGICILFVIITHFEWNEKERLIPIFPYLIDMAVPAFMIISGYFWAISLKRNIVRFSDAYSLGYMVPRLKTYLIPFLIAFFVEMIPYYIFAGGGGENIINILFMGGYGPGSYYVPVLIQLIFIFPIIYWIIRKYNLMGLMICICINFLYEIMKDAYGMTGETYRLVALRYIAILAFGCYFAIGTIKIKIFWMMFLMIIGGLYIFIVTYTSYVPPVLHYWTGTSVLSCMFIVPIMKYLVGCRGIRLKVLEYLGRYSYGIYLVQMVYYFALGKMVREHISNRGVQFAFGFLLCIVAGVIFGIVTDFILKRLPRRNAVYYEKILMKTEKYVNKTFGGK